MRKRNEFETHSEWAARMTARVLIIAAIIAVCISGLTLAFGSTVADAAVINVAAPPSGTIGSASAIQSAITSAAAGDTVQLPPGTWRGSVNLNKGVTLRGTADAAGEPLSRLTAATPGSGDGVKIASDNCAVENLYIENYSMAISAYNSPRSNVRITNNHTYKNQYSCWIDGVNWIVEYNEFERAFYWSGTGDCDYTRMFGRGHVFRRNYIHGSIIPTDLAPLSGSDYAHLDGIQWFGNSGNGEVFQDILIEFNFLTDIVQGFYISNPNSPGDIARVTIRNNVIWGQNNPEAGQLGNRPVWSTLFGSGNGLYPAQGVRFENNLYYNIITFWGGTGGFEGVIQKNIFIAKPNNYSVAYYTEGGSTSKMSGSGDWLWRVQEQGGWNNPANVVGVDPQLVNEGNPLGADGKPFTPDDGWRPRNTLAAPFGPQDVLVPPPAPTPNQPPVANAGPDQSLDVYAGQTVSVTLSGSGSDSDGTVTLWHWSGPVIVDAVQRPTVALGAGVHTFGLRVVDDDGAMSATDEVTITVREIAEPEPEPEIGIDELLTMIADLQKQVTDGAAATHADMNALRARVKALEDWKAKYPAEVRGRNNENGEWRISPARKAPAGALP